MDFAILERDRFYSQGLSLILQEQYEGKRIINGNLAWDASLANADTIFIRCQFSLDALHQSLIHILKRLSMFQWTGTLFLLADERSWALGAMLRKSFASLNIHILDDLLSVSTLSRQLSVSSRTPSPHESKRPLTSNEFKVLNLLISGTPVYMVASQAIMSEKQVSMHKRNALRKLNVNNIVKLLN